MSKKLSYLSTALFAGFALMMAAGPLMAADNTAVSLPGVQMYTGEGGTNITVPGAHVETNGNPNNAAVYAPSPSGYPVQQASYANASLSGMDFSHKNLAGAAFTNATLVRTNFEGSQLTRADFSNADLDGADFAGAILAGARLTNTSLKGANLAGADLSGADLTNASLEGAFVDGARFDGAILTNVDMSRTIHHPAAATPAARPTFVDAGAIASALQTTPGSVQKRKIDLTINFDFNSDALTTDGQRQVEEIAGALKSGALQNAHIMIEGHTDSVGSDAYNKDLSYRRAMSVMRFLVERDGVPASLLSAKGFGKSRPIASNDNDLGRAMNRRVTLVNLGQGQ